MMLPSPHRVLTAPVIAAGLVGGFAVAQATGVRPLGGVVLLGAGLLAGRTWLATRGPATTAALSTAYIGSFVVSHPLAKIITAWPSVAVVTAAASAAAWFGADRFNRMPSPEAALR